MIIRETILKSKAKVAAAAATDAAVGNMTAAAPAGAGAAAAATDAAVGNILAPADADPATGAAGACG